MAVRAIGIHAVRRRRHAEAVRNLTLAPGPATMAAADLHAPRYPEELADRSWDNVGLLLGNADTYEKKPKPVVMVTNDLTYQVAIDAISQGASVIVSYRMSRPLRLPPSVQRT